MDDDFAIKFPDFPDLNFNMNEANIDKDTLDKIDEYLRNDIEEQDKLIRKLAEFERRLDSLNELKVKGNH